LSKGPKIKRALQFAQHRSGLPTPLGLDKVQIFDEILKESLDEDGGSSMHFTLGKLTGTSLYNKGKAETMPISQRDESTHAATNIILNRMGAGSQEVKKRELEKRDSEN
jgi:hypothetical protein